VYSYKLDFARSTERKKNSVWDVDFLRKINDKTDTLRVSIRKDEDDQYYVVFDERTLFDLIKYEPQLCEAIGEWMITHKDFDGAFKWFEAAEKLGQRTATYYLGMIYKKNYNYDQALSKFEEAFKTGNNKALDQISLMYEFAGKRDELVVLLKEYAKRLNTTAMVLLGELYDVESPPEDATPFSSYYWYKKAADAGDVLGMHKLAYSYKMGKCSIGYTMHCDPMYDSAIYWYNRAASLGDYLSMEALAEFYFDGEYVKKDTKTAWNWLEKIMEINKGYGYYAMGDIYETGRGDIKADPKKALEYFRKSYSEGDELAKLRIAELEKAGIK
jgi:TPR repeat protein